MTLEYKGLDYGENKRLNDAAKQTRQLAQPAVSGAAAAPQAPVRRPNVFGPTERPNEPITAGAGAGAGPSNLNLLPPDPVAHIRALYAMFPSEDLRRLLERASERT